MTPSGDLGLWWKKALWRLVCCEWVDNKELVDTRFWTVDFASYLEWQQGLGVFGDPRLFANRFGDKVHQNS